MEDYKALNPYNDILKSNDNDATRIQAYCQSQRSERNARFRVKMLDENFQGVTPDQILSKRLYEPGYVDPRNCLVLWARPTKEAMDVVAICQRRLQEVNPGKFYESSPT